MTPAGSIVDALHYASAATGVSRNYLEATAARESGFDANAKARTSSAAGLFQFIEDTWLSTLARHGPELGMEAAAQRIEFDADGRARVTDPASRGAVLALRFDPTAAALMAGALARDNADALEARLGRSATAGELYTAHVMGAGGALRLLEAAAETPGARADQIFPKEARANRGLFYDRAGAPVSVAGLADRLSRAVEEHSAFADASGAADPVRPATPALHSAALNIFVQPLAGASNLALHSPALQYGFDGPPMALSRAGRAPTPPLLMSSTLVEALASLSAPERADDRDQDRRRSSVG